METVSVGRYTVREGDSALSIAQRVYGDRHLVRRLLDANPEGFSPGNVIDVPGFVGTVMVAGEDEQFPTLFRRAYNNPASMHSAKVEFEKWNGTTVVNEGDQVFFVDLRAKSYGY
jgi:hypothetical protein